MPSKSLVLRVLPLGVAAVLLGGVVVADQQAKPADDVEVKPALVSDTNVPLVSADDQPADDEHADDQGTDESAEDGHDDGDQTVVAHLDRTDVDTFSMLGITWATGSDDYTFDVSVKTDEGWTKAEHMHVEGGDSDEGGRPGTEPLWVGEADALEVTVRSASGVAPTDMKVSTIDPNGTPQIVPTAGSVGQPKIVSRSSWGAAAGTSCDSPGPRPGSVTKGAVIHHTAGSNSYSASQSAGIVKSVQAYHTKSRKWCDIGYNFLVDRYGQIFEGRKGGIDKQVRAAHSGNGPVNEDTVGISMMGTFEKNSVPSATKNAVADLVAWRFSIAGLPAKGTYSLGGKTLNRIAGHRNVVSTACPGAEAYSWVVSSSSSGLRQMVDSRLKNAYELDVPTGLKATPGDTSLALDWDDRAGASTYRVQLSTSSTMSGATYHTFNESKGTINGLKIATKYYYRVAVIDPDTGDKLSDYTGQPWPSVTTTSPYPGGYGLPVPADLKMTSRTGSSLSLDWGDVADAKGYRLQLSTSSSMSGATYHPFTASQGTISGLKPSTTYYFRVAAVESPTGAKASDYTQTPYPSAATTQAYPGGYGLPVPADLKVASKTGTSLSLDWADVSGAQAYRIQLSTKSSMSGATYHPFTASNGTISGLKPGTSYWFRVAAIDPSTGAKASDYTQTPYPSTVTTATNAGGYAMPVPGSLKTTSVSSSSLALDWADVGGAEQYRIQLSTKSSMSGATYYRFNASNGTISGLKSGTTYWFRVAVVDPSSGAKLSDYTQTPYPSAKTTGTAQAASTSSAKNSVTVPSSRTISFKGHGYGHGIGMSQYGAQGAARQGKTWTQILSAYYPGTSRSTKSGDIRVHITADTTDSVMIEAKSGITFRQGSTKISLPTTIGGKKVVRWSIDPSSSDKKKSTLRYRTGSSYVTYDNRVWTGEAQFEASTLELVLPKGGNKVYRDTLRSALPKSGATYRDTVNVLSIEDYVRGVVAREMPSSWHAEALKAQSVAARTYGVRGLNSSRYYDMCDTTSCQVYGGVSAETSATDSAVKATAGTILTHGGKPAFTQFSSSSGGYTNVGSQPYLKAVSDDWDDWSGNKNHAWTISVKASTIEKKYTSIGTLKSISVTKRNGYGDMGGRVSSLKLTGSKGTKTISGVDARWAFGLRSDWFGF